MAVTIRDGAVRAGGSRRKADQACRLPIARCGARLAVNYRGRTVTRPFAGSMLINSVKVFFFCATLRADPIVWQVGKGCSGLDAVFKISLGGIVDIAARAFHLLHSALLLSVPVGCASDQGGFVSDCRKPRRRQVPSARSGCLWC